MDNNPSNPQPESQPRRRPTDHGILDDQPGSADFEAARPRAKRRVRNSIRVVLSFGERHPVISWIVRRILSVGDTLGWIATIASIIGFVGGWYWLLDLFSHWRMQYVLLLVVGSLSSLLLLRWKRSLLFAAAFILNAITLVPFYYPPQAPALAASPEIHLLSFNIKRENKNRTEIINYIRSSGADIVLLLETGPGWAKDIKDANLAYTIVCEEEHLHNFGVVLLARIPVSKATITNYGQDGVTAATCVFQLGRHEVRLLGIHPPPPVGSTLAANRDRELREAGHWLLSHKQPAILMGDFNTTPWGYPFRALVRDTGFISAMKGNGLSATWDGHWMPLSIPIDHCLYSPELTCVLRRTGPRLGSDHVPVHYTLALAATTITR